MLFEKCSVNSLPHNVLIKSRIYKITNKKASVNKCCFLLPKCAKNHVHASVISNIFTGLYAQTPLNKGRGKKRREAEWVRVRERRERE
jgi:hypothetical protein